MFTGKSTVIYQDFEKLDFRIGTIISATVPEWSTKLLKFVVDFGKELGTRVIFSGIQKWYQPDEFIEKQYCFLLNLEPKKMGIEESQGMMLMIDVVDENEHDTEKSNTEKPILFPVQFPVKNGAVVR